MRTPYSGMQREVCVFLFHSIQQNLKPSSSSNLSESSAEELKTEDGSTSWRKPSNFAEWNGKEQARIVPRGTLWGTTRPCKCEQRLHIVSHIWTCIHTQHGYLVTNPPAKSLEVLDIQKNQCPDSAWGQCMQNAEEQFFHALQSVIALRTHEAA